MTNYNERIGKVNHFGKKINRLLIIIYLKMTEFTRLEVKPGNEKLKV